MHSTRSFPATSGLPNVRNPGHVSLPSLGDALRVLGIRCLNYVTNHIVAHVPSYTVRHGWYRQVLGIGLAPSAGIHLGCYVWFYGPSANRRNPVSIGEHSHINRDCTLDVRGGLRIGDNVSVSPGVVIITSAKQSTSRGGGEGKRVVIEDNAWVGVRAVVLPGVTIGHGAVVGAGSVVMQDVPPFAVVVGSPARAVGKRTPDEARYVLDGGFPLFE